MFDYSQGHTMVQIGKLADPEIFKFKQQKVLGQEIADLEKRVRMLRLEQTLLAERVTEEALTRLGLPSSSVCTIAASDYSISVPQWLAEERGLIAVKP